MLLGAELPGPVDRPNLSKDYLAGTAPEEWIPLRTREALAEQKIELVANDPVVRIDAGGAKRDPDERALGELGCARPRDGRRAGRAPHRRREASPRAHAPHAR